MWHQLADAQHINNIGPEITRQPGEFAIERDWRLEEGLKKLERLRSARLAGQASRSRKRDRV